MAKRFRNLIDPITSDANMRRACRRTARGKRLTGGYLEFKEYAEVNLADLSADLRAGCYVPGPYREFTIYEPKRRVIAALPFRDRVAQHALVDVIGPIFERALLPRTFACRIGFGTHAGVVALQADMRRLGAPLYFLKTDFSKFFHSVDRHILHRMIRSKISCRRTLEIIEEMVSPDGVGLPIGSLTSQLFANVYAGAVDRLLQCELGEQYWYRYMDDIVVLGRDLPHLRRLQEWIETFARDVLHLSLSKWMVASVGHGVNFLGYRIWPTHKLLRRHSVISAKRKIAAYSRRGERDKLAAFLPAWLGHAGWADAHHLLRWLGLVEMPI